MTKDDAKGKVSKLLRLAEKAGTPQEADSARRTAAEIKKKYGITDEELSLGTKAAAFDDLVGKLDAHARRHPEMPPAVFEVLTKMKTDMSEDDKAASLVKLVGTIRVAALFLGSKKMGGVKEVVEDALRRYSLTI